MNIEKYAESLGVELYKEYAAKDAAKILKVGINTLNYAANEGKVSFIQTGIRNRLFLGMDLISWRLNSRKPVNRQINTGSEITGSQDLTRDTGAELGTAVPLDKQRLQALAHKTLTPRSRR